MIVEGGQLYISSTPTTDFYKVETTTKRVIQVSCGRTTNSALDETGFVWVWG